MASADPEEKFAQMLSDQLLCLGMELSEMAKEMRAALDRLALNKGGDE